MEWNFKLPRSDEKRGWRIVLLYSAVNLALAVGFGLVTEEYILV